MLYGETKTQKIQKWQHDRKKKSSAQNRLKRNKNK